MHLILKEGLTNMLDNIHAGDRELDALRDKRVNLGVRLKLLGVELSDCWCSYIGTCRSGCC